MQLYEHLYMLHKLADATKTLHSFVDDSMLWSLSMCSDINPDCNCN